MPTLYHYSPLFHLPPILVGGLSRGEIAQPDYRRNQQAVSLTTQSDPERMFCWGSKPLPFKLAVRYICRIPDDDDRLESARSAWKRLGTSRRWREVFDPKGQSKWWYFYHGTIPTDWFTVELRGRAGYVPLTRPAQVVEAVNAAREKCEFVVPPEKPWCLEVRAKVPGEPLPCLMSEVYPAGIFGEGKM